MAELAAAKSFLHYSNESTENSYESAFALLFVCDTLDNIMGRLKKIALDAAILIKDLAEENPDTEWTFEYSPESFTGTELDYARDVCDEVVDILKTASKNKIIRK